MYFALFFLDESKYYKAQPNKTRQQNWSKFSQQTGRNTNSTAAKSETPRLNKTKREH
jgi:hypothetical protein